MDFLDPKQRKKHNQRLALGYVLMAILIGLATYILFLIGGVGYGVNRKTGDVIQNGLVLVAANPGDAIISLDGVEQSKGEARLNIPAGEHKLTISLDGYQQWEKTITVDPGGIERIIYPVLFPLDIKPVQQVKFTQGPIMTTQSPNQKWLISQLPDGTLALIDLSKSTTATTMTLPGGLVTATPNQGVSAFVTQEWSDDNRHVLLGHKLDSGNMEYIVIDREFPEKSLNINQQFRDRNITKLTLRDKKHDKFYIYDSVSSELSKADSQTNVTLVASNVSQYKSYKDDALLYVTKPAAGSDKVDLHFTVRDKKILLRKLPISSNYLLDIAEFDGKLFVVAGSASDGRNYIYKDIMATYEDGFKSATPYRVLIVDNPSSVSFSTTARFISVQSSTEIVLYDTETDDQIGYDRPSDWIGTNPAKWMDGHRLVNVNKNGTVRVMEFDSSNDKVLAELSSGTNVFFDSNYESMFGFSHDSDNSYNLVKVELRLK